MDITAEKIIDTYYNEKPRLLWKIDHDTYGQVKKIRDASGVYLWTPDLVYKEKPGQLLGMEIALVDPTDMGAIFNLVIVYSENTEIICRKDFS